MMAMMVTTMITTMIIMTTTMITIVVTMTTIAFTCIITDHLDHLVHLAHQAQMVPERLVQLVYQDQKERPALLVFREDLLLVQPDRLVFLERQVPLVQLAHQEVLAPQELLAEQERMA